MQNNLLVRQPAHKNTLETTLWSAGLQEMVTHLRARPCKCDCVHLLLSWHFCNRFAIKRGVRRLCLTDGLIWCFTSCQRQVGIVSPPLNGTLPGKCAFEPGNYAQANTIAAAVQLHAKWSRSQETQKKHIIQCLGICDKWKILNYQHRRIVYRKYTQSSSRLATEWYTPTAYLLTFVFNLDPAQGRRFRLGVCCIRIQNCVNALQELYYAIWLITRRICLRTHSFFFSLSLFALQ